MIGTGASAAQFIPEIQPKVAHLSVFQRTPAWVLPRADARIRPWQRRLFRRLRVLRVEKRRRAARQRAAAGAGGQRSGRRLAHPCWIDTDLVRDARHDLPAFDQIVRRLPGPFGTVTSPQVCAEALMAAIEGRRRKVFVPKSLALVAAVRSLLTSAIAERRTLRDLGPLLGDLERQASELGRPFGENSVETGCGASRRSA